MSEIKLYHGDCLEVMGGVADKSVDLILCDLPYNVTACEWDILIPFDKLWEQYNRIIKDNGAIVLFGTEPFSTQLKMSNLKHYKYDWIWNKVRGVGFQIAKYRPMQQHEYISVFCNGKLNYYPIMKKRDKVKKSKNYSNSKVCRLQSNDMEERIYTEKYPTSILTYSNASQKGRLHPTQKPTELLEYLIKTYTKEYEVVLDNCMGSGSTGVACINTNRSFIGIEKDEKYFEIAKKRIEECQQDIFTL